MNYKYLFEATLKNIDEGVIIVDQDANVMFYNEPATLVSGVTLELAVGKNILELFPELTPQTSTFYKVLRSKEPVVNHFQTSLNFQGKKISVLTCAMPIIEEGNLIGAIEIYKDLTNVKNLSDKVVNLQKELFKNKSLPQRYKGNGSRYTFEDIIGKSSAINTLIIKAKKVADSDSPILIYGETGTGKELFVQAIHNASNKRKSYPFIAQNCAAIPRTLLEGILFGTSSGSFTGAKDKPGLFELANGGTLFLDEINSMDIDLQAKLLRVLQEGVVRRIGDQKMIEVDVRVIACTNEKPLKAVERNKIREDLYYRLNVISLNLPTLRERKEDIDLLIEYFINIYNKKFNIRVKGISENVKKIFLRYSWPGNVRELKYTIESILNFIDEDIIQVKHISEKILRSYKGLETYQEEKEEKSDSGKITSKVTSLRDAVNFYEKDLIIKALKETKGNSAKAARLLKVPKQTLYSKLKKYEINWEIDMK